MMKHWPNEKADFNADQLGRTIQTDKRLPGMRILAEEHKSPLSEMQDVNNNKREMDYYWTSDAEGASIFFYASTCHQSPIP